MAALSHHAACTCVAAKLNILHTHTGHGSQVHLAAPVDDAVLVVPMGQAEDDRRQQGARR
jgi:hypothetical protein